MCSARTKRSGYEAGQRSTVDFVDGVRRHRYRAVDVQAHQQINHWTSRPAARRTAADPGGTHDDRAAYADWVCWVASAAMCVFLAGGCSPRVSTFTIIDYREAGRAARYRETFDEAYYTLHGQGNIEIVLRSVDPGREGDLTQVICIESVWRSIPGRTTAETTQINGVVTYMIVDGRIGATFEGAGSVFFDGDKRSNSIEGELELANLTPTRQLAAGGALFQRAQLQGTFYAKRDARRVARIKNDIERRFGPKHARPLSPSGKESPQP